MARISGDAVRDLARSFERTAILLETRERYDKPGYEELLSRFLAGKPDDLEWVRPWLDQVRESTAAGRTFRRVRIVSVPLSDYNRWALAVSEHNSAAGEDIRYLNRDEAEGLPDFDYWVFDDERIAKIHCDERDWILGAEVVNDPAEAAVLSAAFEDAWGRSIPRATFAEAHRLG